MVANPAAGRGRAARLIPGVARALASAGVEHRILVSRSPSDAQHLARCAAEEGSAVVAALGGDGLVGMVANGVVGTDAALAVIPGGNGNDFSRALGLDRRHPIRAALLLRSPRIAEIDAARVSAGSDTRIYMNVAGAGFDSEVSETANRMRMRAMGSVRYAVAVVSTLRAFTPARFDLSIDGTERAITGMLVAVGNGGCYGGGMRVCPDASLSDGELEVCIIGAMGRAEFLRAFPSVFRGAHVSHPKVTMLRGKQVQIRADRAAQVYADGEQVGPLPAAFEVLPRAIKVVVP